MTLNYDILDDLEARQCNAIEKLTEEKEIDTSAHDFYESLVPYKKDAELFLVQIRYNNINIEDTIDMFRMVANRFFAECLNVQCVNSLYDLNNIVNRKKFPELYQEANEAEMVLDNNSIISFGTHILFKIAVRKYSNLSTKREIVNLLNFLSSIYSISIQNDNSTVMVVDYELVDVLPHQISFNAEQLYSLKHNHLKMTPLEYPPRFVKLYRLAQEMYIYLKVKVDADIISEIIQKWWNKYAYIKEIYTYEELENFTITYKKNRIMANSFYGAAGAKVFDPTKIFTLTVSET
jgi:hypothetical protein